jgi:hypothetical protein
VTIDLPQINALDNPDQQSMVQLKSRLSTANKSWLLEFTQVCVLCCI